MKNLLLAIVIVLGGKFVQAQKTPYPTKEAILKDAKTNYALGMISLIYGSQLTWDKVKLEYLQFVNGGTKVTPWFTDYQSDLAQRGRLDYDDMTEIPIIAITPKNEEGKVFEIGVTLIYTRHGGVMPAKTWTFKETNVSSSGYYVTGGSHANDLKRVNEIIPTLKKYNGKDTPNKPVYYDLKANGYGETDIVMIDSIYVDQLTNDENLSAQRYKYFTIACTVREVKDGGKIIYYPGSTIGLQVQWGLNSSTNKWSIKEMTTQVTTLNKARATSQLSSEDTSDKEYKSLGVHGFDAVYKTQSTVTRSRYTETDLGAFEKTMQDAIELTIKNSEKGKKAIEELVDPDLSDFAEIVNSYYEPIIMAKQLLVNIESVNTSINSWTEDDSENPGKKKIVIGSASIDIGFAREGAVDKVEIKRYQDAGISKETIKTKWGGVYRESMRSNELGVVFKNNRWYITKKGDTVPPMN